MNIILKSGAFIIAASLLTTGLGPTQTFAQTAKNLKCKGCVGKKDIGKKAVKSKHIKPGQITGAHIDNGAVAPADLSNAAKPSGADFVESSADTDLNPGGSDIVLESVTVTAPGPGVIVATVSVSANLNGVPGDVVCTLTEGTAIGGVYAHGEAADGHIPFSHTRAFAVDTAGDVTVNLVCREVSGDVRMENPMLAAWFVPGAY